MSRVAVFIDNNSLFQALSKLDSCGLDYIRLRRWLVGSRSAELVKFYCGEVREDAVRRKPFYNFLERAGFEIITIFQSKSRFSNAAFDTDSTRKVHCEMAFDMCETLLQCQIRRMILVSGSPDLSRVVRKIREKGTDVELVFFEEFCSPALRRGASVFRRLKIDGLLRGQQTGRHGGTHRDQIATRIL